MEFTCAVWYKGALAHYYVVETGINTYAIRLLNTVTKNTQIQLPRKVSICKRGGDWVGDHPDKEFITDLIGAINANKTVRALVSD